MANLLCPKCRKEPMRPETFEGIEIDRCPVCKGMFFDRGELHALLSNKDEAAGDSLAFAAISDVMDTVMAHCPRCDKDMDAVTGPANVRLDVCGRCEGVFLDQGEFATLQLAQSEV